LAIDPGTFRDVAWTRGDLAAAPMDRLEQKLVDQDPDGLRLAGRPVQLALWVWSSGLGAELSADVTDASGRACACALGSLNFTGDRVLTVPLSIPAGASYPLRLRRFRAHTTGDGPTGGEIVIRDKRDVADDGLPTLCEPCTCATH